MRGLGVPVSDVKMIVGHTDEDLTFGRYGDKVGVEVLRVPINKLSYDLAHATDTNAAD